MGRTKYVLFVPPIFSMRKLILLSPQAQ